MPGSFTKRSMHRHEEGQCRHRGLLIVLCPLNQMFLWNWRSCLLWPPWLMSAVQMKGPAPGVILSANLFTFRKLLRANANSGKECNCHLRLTFVSGSASTSRVYMYMYFKALGLHGSECTSDKGSFCLVNCLKKLFWLGSSSENFWAISSQFRKQSAWIQTIELIIYHGLDVSKQSLSESVTENPRVRQLLHVQGAKWRCQQQAFCTDANRQQTVFPVIASKMKPYYLQCKINFIGGIRVDHWNSFWKDQCQTFHSVNVLRHKRPGIDRRGDDLRSENSSAFPSANECATPWFFLRFFLSLWWFQHKNSKHAEELCSTKAIRPNC